MDCLHVRLGLWYSAINNEKRNHTRITIAYREQNVERFEWHMQTSKSSGKGTAGYIFTKLRKEISVGSVISLHYYEYAPNFRGTEESHDFWELVYADSGNLICCAGKQEIHLSQGQAVLHPPNEIHRVLTIGKDSSACIFSFTCLQLPIEMFRGRTVELNQNQKNLVGMIYQEGRTIFEGPYNCLYQAKLKRRKTVPYGAEQVFGNTLENLLLLIVRDQLLPAVAAANAPGHGRVRNDRDIADGVVAYLNANLYRKLRVADISSALSFSESYLQEVFRKQKNQSVVQYFNGMKIYQAKKLIGEANYTFTQIAQMLGFSSVHYFSRIFRHYVKMSPTEYKNP
jgi:AraC-like DNA-binding protein/quercetin dioxygenase-like cupin family protein